MKTLTEKTLLPISLVIVLIMGVGWLTNLAAQATATDRSVAETRAEIREIRVEQRQYLDSLQAIKEGVARLEEQMKRRSLND